MCVSALELQTLELQTLELQQQPIFVAHKVAEAFAVGHMLRFKSVGNPT